MQTQARPGVMPTKKKKGLRNKPTFKPNLQPPTNMPSQ